MSGRPVSYIEQRWKAVEARLAALEAAGSTPGQLAAFAMPAAPNGWLECDGAAVLISAYDELAAAIYCGDSANASAAWGYRATTSVSPGSNRSTSGTYIVLPDYRGQFLRGWDDGRGLDPARSLFSAQSDEFETHSHVATAANGGIHTHVATVDAGTGGHSHTYQESSVTTNTNTTATGASARVVTHDLVPTSTTGSGAHTHTLTVQNSTSHTHDITVNGAGGAETRPTNLAALICIKT